jgi:hypothetical protein
MGRIVGCAMLLTVAAAGIPACTAPKEPASVAHDDPSVKIRGMKKAARERDVAVVRQLVKDLDSDDPAVRFYAIRSLGDLTGEDFGYRYYHDEVQRRESLGRWQEWLNERAATVQAAK